MYKTERSVELLRWLYARGNNGVFNKYGKMMCGGEECPLASMPVWVKLFAFEMIVGSENGRVKLTKIGKDIIDEKFLTSGGDVRRY